MVLKIVYILGATFGIVLIFYVSWFWRLLLAPMIVILVWDFVSRFLGKKNERGKL